MTPKITPEQWNAPESVERRKRFNEWLLQHLKEQRPMRERNGLFRLQGKS